MTEPIIPPRTLVIVCAILLVLTGLTLVAYFIDLGVFHTPVALAIAGFKALLIALYFMQLRHSTGLTRIILLVGLAWMALLLFGTLDDVLTRGWILAGH